MDDPEMDGARVRAVRETLGVTQAQLAALLGAHAVTVARWEGGRARPTPFQCALLGAFEQAGARAPRRARAAAFHAGAAPAPQVLYAVLAAAFDRRGD